MRVLLHSNGVHVPTGYGSQAEIFTSFMADEGHDVFISAFFGLQSKTLPLRKNLVMLPGEGDMTFGMENLQIYHEQLKPDATVLLMDAWVCDARVLEKVDAIFWAPIDHQPAPPLVIDRLRACKQVWAMSRFGLRMMRDANLTDAWYVPHGIRTDVFTPTDREAAREKWQLPKDAFIVTCTAANKGWPSRKSLPQLLKAWSFFVRTHKDAVLVLHTDPKGKHGIDLHAAQRFYAIPDANVHFPSEYALAAGVHEPRHLNELYAAGDVFCLPSAGEGFGIPAVEAQAAGSPVILTDFSAQSELCGAGWLIEVDPMDRFYTPQHSEQAWVSAGAILDALNMAYEARGDTAQRAKAREFALQYDARRVWETHMKPALLAAVNGETDAQRTAARRALRPVDPIKEDIQYLAQHGVLVGPPLEAAS
jgi:glycosyltransferase involved in cell wall biosynthesis